MVRLLNFNKNMKQKILLFISVLFILGAGCKKDVEKTTDVLTGLESVQLEKKANQDLAVAKAKDLFKQKAGAEVDMSDGPCLSNEIIVDWVVDVAHNPRQPIDDKPENQCSAFREGKAHHFVELDTNGNVINIK